jgi:pimeloyl-ACP methyl ester carboxylesterase
MHDRMSPVSWLALGTTMLLVATSACSGDNDEMSAPDTTSAPPEAVDFSVRGPFAVGVTELDGDPPVLVFYPSDRDAVPSEAKEFTYTSEQMAPGAIDAFPFAWDAAVDDSWFDVPASSDGPFPLVVFSHGWGANRFTYARHNSHVASWGFVVAAPQHASRDFNAFVADRSGFPVDVDTLATAIDLLREENARADGVLEGRIDTQRTAVEGHSAGGRDAALMASDVVIDTWISLSGTPPVPDDAQVEGSRFELVPAFDLGAYLATNKPPAKPSLLLAAENDVAVEPHFTEAVYAALGAPKRLVVLAGTGHVVFFDGCADFQQGRVPGLVSALGLDPASPEVEQAENGCRPDDAPVEKVWAATNHLVVAHLRWALGVDADVAASSLSQTFVADTFTGVVAEHLVDG